MCLNEIHLQQIYKNNAILKENTFNWAVVFLIRFFNDYDYFLTGKSKIVKKISTSK